MYGNYLLLSVAIHILVNPSFSFRYAEKARRALVDFVEHCKTLYGDKSIVYNFHNLIHLPDDVKRYGSLDNISAFRYENSLQGLKKLVRKPNNVLQQIILRVGEGKNNVCKNTGEQASGLSLQPIVKKCHTDGPLPFHCGDTAGALQYKTVQLPSFFV